MGEGNASSATQRYALEDRTPLRFAALAEQALGRYTPPPGL
jgi:hypothetical protein